MKTDKIDDITLALLQLVVRRDAGGAGTHASTHLDVATLQRLQEKGLLGELDEQAGVIAMTGEGADRSRELFEAFFGEPEADSQPAEVEPIEPDARDENGGETSASEVYLDDAFLDDPVVADGTLRPLSLEAVERHALVEQLSSRQLRGDVYIDTSEEKMIRLGPSDPAPPASDQRFLKVDGLPVDEHWHDMSDFASLVRKVDLAAWIHDVVEDSESVEEFCEQLDRVEGLLDAWQEFDRDRSRHRLDQWLADHGYELAEPPE